MTLPAAGDHLSGFTWRIDPGEPSTPLTFGNAKAVFGSGTYTVTAGDQTLNCTVNGDDVVAGSWTGPQTRKIKQHSWDLRRNGARVLSGPFVPAKVTALVDAQVVEVVVGTGDTVTIEAVGGGAGVALPIAISDVTGLQTSLDSKATGSALTAHTSNTSNPHSVTKAQVGLGNVDNTSDAAKPLSTAATTALAGKADLDVGGKVPASQLPSYVDDVLEYANLAAFPVTGEPGKIYVAADTNQTYRWSGSVYVDISGGGGGVALGETSMTAYRGDRGKTAYDHSQTAGNPHDTTYQDLTGTPPAAAVARYTVADFRTMPDGVPVSTNGDGTLDPEPILVSSSPGVSFPGEDPEVEDGVLRHQGTEAIGIAVLSVGDLTEKRRITIGYAPSTMNGPGGGFPGVAESTWTEVAVGVTAGPGGDYSVQVLEGEDRTHPELKLARSMMGVTTLLDGPYDVGRPLTTADRVSIEVDGDDLRGYLNGVEILSATDATISRGSMLGAIVALKSASLALPGVRWAVGAVGDVDEQQVTSSVLAAGLAGKVPVSRTVAGLDLSADRSAAALKAALAITVSDVSGAVPTTRTLAGLDLSANRSDSALRAALNVANGATANDTDANLRARSSHTGTQTSSTIGGVATARLLGRTTAGTGTAEELTATQVRDLLGLRGITVKSTDTSRANTTTRTADPGLDVTVPVGTVVYRARLLVSGSTAADLSLDITAGTATFTVASSVVKGHSNGWTGTPGTGFLVLGPVPNTTIGTSGTVVTEVEVCAVLDVTVAGTVQVSWAQATSNASSVSMLKGSTAQVVGVA